MKQIASVCMAAARTVVWKLLLLIILMAGAETVLFWRALQVVPPEYQGGFGYFVQESRIRFVFFAALVALCVILCLQGSQFSGGKMVYTLQRLPLSEETVTLLWAAAHVGCLVILWAFQLVTVCGLWILYIRFGPSSGQTLELFVNVYSQAFLHGLLPLADVTRHVRNVLWVLSLGFSTAAFGYFQRRGRFRMETVILLSVGVAFFSSGMGSTGTDITLSLLWLALVGTAVYRYWRVCHETD